MKSLQKNWRVLAAAILAAALFTGCKGADAVKEEPLNTYTAESGMFSVSLPGEWTEGDTMGLTDLMNLSRDDGMEAVIMGMTKGQLLGQGGSNVESLEDFFNYADALFLNGAAATTELDNTESIALAGMTATIAKDGTMTQKNGASGKLYIECGETERAYYLLMFSGTKGYDKKIASIKTNLGFEELEIPEPETLADTLRWFNASYAVITSLNGGDLNIPAGYEPGSMIETSMKTMLERDWGVTDQASLEETVERLITKGHNSEALDYLAQSGTEGMTREDLITAMETNGFDDEEQTIMLAAFDAKNAYGDHAIAGWDLSRAMSLLGWGYLAGFYTYEEAMDKSLVTAQMIQQEFTSWDDFMNSYFYGYSYWSGNAPEDTDSQAYKRRRLFEEIKEEDNSPFSADWNTSLQKVW